MSAPNGRGARGKARREFLRLAVLAPAAVACATARTTVAVRAAAPSAAASAGTKEDPEPFFAAVEAVRSAPLPADATPACVFRALRGRERR